VLKDKHNSTLPQMRSADRSPSFVSEQLAREKSSQKGIGNCDVEICPGYLKKGVELTEAELVAWSKHLPMR